jgi:hypothetical protein
MAACTAVATSVQQQAREARARLRDFAGLDAALRGDGDAPVFRGGLLGASLFHTLRATCTDLASQLQSLLAQRDRILV